MPASRARIADIAEAVASAPTALVLVAEAKGSTPRETGAYMIVTPGTIRGTIGGGEAERRGIEAARSLLATGGLHDTLSLPLGPDLDQCCGGRLGLAIARVDRAPDGPFALWEGGPRVEEPPARTVCLYGAGHVGTALAEALAPLPFALRWVDGRAESVWPVATSLPLNRVAIPEAEVARADDSAFHVVMTHSHALDLEIVAAVLARPFGFCGLIGSATKRATFTRRLAERGLDTAGLTCPIGLPTIPGKEPAVIAASVVAELLTVERSRSVTRIIERGRLRPFDGAITGDDPFTIRSDGAILFEDGEVVEHGPAKSIIAANPDAVVVPTDRLLVPGLSDAHTHFPQTRVRGTYGGGLLDWLDDVTFPEEARFEDPAYAREVAEEFFDHLEAAGTTDVTVFCTSHPASVDALFTAALDRTMTVTAGLVMMDRNAPAPLLMPAQDAYDAARTLIERWHGAADGRFTYAITPRFAPTSSPALLEAAGALWREHPDCMMQTHLSESEEEVAWVRRLYPDALDYLDVYERFGLVGPGAIFAHAIHLSDREVARLAESGAIVAHCPTANRFLRSGRCDVARLLEAGVGVRLGTDVGAGSTFDIMEVAREAEGVPRRKQG